MMNGIKSCWFHMNFHCGGACLCHDVLGRGAGLEGWVLDLVAHQDGRQFALCDTHSQQDESFKVSD